MKNTLILLTAVALTLFAATGCSTLDKVLLAPNITPAVTNTVSGAIEPSHTNYVVAPAVADGIATANTYAPLIPAPYNLPVTAALALLSAGLGIYARQRNGQLSTANAIVNAVVSGVEAVGHPETKAAIQNAAVAAGVQSQLDSVVQPVGQAMK